MKEEESLALPLIGVLAVTEWMPEPPPEPGKTGWGVRGG